MMAFTALGIYNLLMLKKLLNERYNFSSIDILLIISIWWGVVFQIGSLLIKLVFLTGSSLSQTTTSITQAVFSSPG